MCETCTQFENGVYLYQQVSKAANNYKRQKISHMTTTNTTTATSTKSLAFKAAHKSAKNQIARGFKGAYKFFFAQALKDFYKKLKIEKMLSEMPVIAQSVSDVEFSTYLAYVD